MSRRHERHWNRGVLLAGFALLASGCDGWGGASGPPRVAAPVAATTLAVLLPDSGIADLEVWESTARRQLQPNALIEIHRMAPGDPPSLQASMIGRAVEGGASALIVVADEPPAQSQAIAEARKGGVPVVLLDRAVPDQEEPPPPRVAYAPERDSAKALVSAAMEDARAAGFPPEGPAMILANGPGDDHARARVEGLRHALEEAGVRVLPVVRFSGAMEYVRPALLPAYWPAPHVAMVFAEDDAGLRAAAVFRYLLDRGNRRFVVAGYAADPQTREMMRSNLCAAIVDRNVAEAMRRAIETALALVRGETVASEIIVPTPLLRASGPLREDALPSFLQTREVRDKQAKAREDEPPDSERS